MLKHGSVRTYLETYFLTLINRVQHLDSLKVYDLITFGEAYKL
jgi:hypothetical protein